MVFGVINARGCTRIRSGQIDYFKVAVFWVRLMTKAFTHNIKHNLYFTVFCL
jgi:hypothetical protein